MNVKRRQLSRPFYYILLSILASLPFGALAAAAWLASSLALSRMLALVLSFLLLHKAILLGLVVWFVGRRSPDDDFGVRFIGSYLGRFYGCIAGLFAGYGLTRILGQGGFLLFLAIVVALFFAGWKLGSRLSLFVDRQMRGAFTIEALPAPSSSPLTVGRPSSLAVAGLYVVLLPAALACVGAGIAITVGRLGLYTAWLPTARLVAALATVAVLATAWAIRHRWLQERQTEYPSAAFAVGVLGLNMSTFPVACGFILFLAFEASLYELVLSALVSSAAALLWLAANRIPPLGEAVR